MLLTATEIRGGFSPEVDILNDVNLEIGTNEIVTVAGTNGAGKSTLVKAIMGLLPRMTGTIQFEGRDLQEFATEDRVGLGIAYVPQVANVFLSLSVFENLDVVEFPGSRHARRARVEEVLFQFPRLRERLKSRGDHLSGGERQQLAFARALMLRPKLMLLDEPTAALSVGLAQQVFEQIRTLPILNVAALVVEQQARQSLAISDRGYILDAGKVVMKGRAADLLADEKMASLYLGQAIDAKPLAADSGRPKLRVHSTGRGN